MTNVTFAKRGNPKWLIRRGAERTIHSACRRGLTGAMLVALLCSCAPLPFLPTPTPLPPEPTATSLPPTETPTSTPVWFPMTPTNTPLPTAGITPSPDLRPQYGALIFEEVFNDPSLWTLSMGQSGSIALGKDELTIALSQPGAYLYTARKQPPLGDFYAEITASPTLCRGEDEYGLLIHFTSAADFFRFSLTCNGQVRVDRVLRGVASSPMPLTFSSAVPQGAPSSSRLGVWAIGREMQFFINDQYQFTVRDASIPKGNLGVFARSNGENAVTVNYSNLKVYQP